jgi:hypothetical protein
VGVKLSSSVHLSGRRPSFSLPISHNSRIEELTHFPVITLSDVGNNGFNHAVAYVSTCIRWTVKPRHFLRRESIKSPYFKVCKFQFMGGGRDLLYCMLPFRISKHFYKTHCFKSVCMPLLRAGIATGYGLEDWMIGVRFPAETGNLSLQSHVQTGSGALPSLLSNRYLGFFPWG